LIVDCAGCQTRPAPIAMFTPVNHDLALC
jgi:hypothetical protein